MAWCSMCTYGSALYPAASSPAALAFRRRCGTAACSCRSSLTVTVNSSLAAAEAFLGCLAAEVGPHGARVYGMDGGVPTPGTMANVTCGLVLRETSAHTEEAASWI
jgi:hypothetical protein